jgi:hypothetical protein
MVDSFMLFLLLLSAVLILFVIGTILNGSFICPYIKRNGRSTGRGAYLGWAQIVNASIADDVADKNEEHPWFLKLFWMITFLQFGLIIGGIIFFVIFLKN